MSNKPLGPPPDQMPSFEQMHTLFRRLHPNDYDAKQKIFDLFNDIHAYQLNMFLHKDHFDPEKENEFTRRFNEIRESL